MGRLFEFIKAGMKGVKEGTEPHGYSLAGKPIRCPHCGHTRFAPASALLNTRGLTVVNLDWADPQAAILICAECGRIEWYAQPPEETPS